MKKGTYIASRASILARSEAWRKLRDEDRYVIVSSWINEAGEGETYDFGELWTRIENEVCNAERLVLYVEPDDFPLKGALVEVGMALAAKVPVFMVAPGVVMDERTLRPVGSWAYHPLVKFVDTMEEALIGANRY